MIAPPRTIWSVTEWAVEFDQVGRALVAIRNHIERSGIHVHFPIEIRFSGGAAPRPRGSNGTAANDEAVVGGDDIWLSPAYARPVAWIGLIMYRPFGQPVAFEEYFGAIERILNDDVDVSTSNGGGGQTAAATAAPFQGKPHWAKNVVMPLRSIPFARRYPRWNDFKSMRQRLDPNHMFSNELVHRLLDDEDEEEGGKGTRVKKTPAKHAATLPLPSAL
jgi:L-gulonolactone oxidase